jgi:hypothetical protein
MEFEDFLQLTGSEAEREELLRSGQRFYDATQPSSSEREELLDQVMERVQWSLRAARHPLPTRAELEAMLLEYFDDGGG